jgi:hypothetical protein
MNKRVVSIETIHKVGALLLFTGQIEQEIELTRQRLCKAIMFEPYAAFQRLDRGGKGYITAPDFLKFMR